jgi:hypothetical protein
MKGWDSFTIEPGTVECMVCRVCRTTMQVDRNVEGPTSFAETMGKGKHLHDHFYCADAEKDWHRQALAILQLAKATPSKQIEESLKEEVEKILETKQATKTSWR